MNDNTIALVLAAGGSRGAYQAGAMLFLAERGIKFNAVAGTSIGALNGAYYAQTDGSAGAIQRLIDYWRAIPAMRILVVNPEAFFAAMRLLYAQDFSTITNLATGAYTLLDPKPIAIILDKWIDYAKVCASPITMTLTVLSEIAPLLDIVLGPWRRASYLYAHELTPATLRKALFATAAMPLVYPSQDIEGQKFADAGLVDPLPAQVLYRDGVRRIVSIFLSDNTVQNRADYHDARLFQIRPSQRINRGFASMLDFSQQTIDDLIDLGYQDARDYYREAQELFNGIVRLRERGNRIQKLADDLPERSRHLLPGSE